MSVLQQNYAEVCRRIAEAEQKAGRQAGEVGLIAVSKTFPSDDIREVYAAMCSQTKLNLLPNARIGCIR